MSLYFNKWRLLLYFGDLICLFLSIIVALHLNTVTLRFPWYFLISQWFQFLSLGCVYFLVLFIGEFYDYQADFRQLATLGRLLATCWIATVIVVIIFYFPPGAFLGRTLLLIQAASFSILLALWRFIFSSLAFPQRLRKRILIIGAGNSGLSLLRAIRKHPRCGIQPVGFADDNHQKVGANIEGLPVLGDSSLLPSLVNDYRISAVIVAIRGEKSPRLMNTLIRISWNGCKLMDMPAIFEFLSGKIPTSFISEHWIYESNLNSNKFYYRYFKRFFDITLATIILFCTLPLLPVIALLIRLDSPGPILFRQERLGQESKPFTIIKFRTMINNASNCGPHWTRNKDPRITKVGKLIRKLKLDELPQVFNIIRGEMSFIGPRPLIHCELNESIPYFNYRFLLKPGITGWAQVMFPDGLSQDTTEEKLKYDLYYIKNIGLLLDIAILLKTVRIVLFGRGI